jgi:hypothetical protein
MPSASELLSSEWRAADREARRLEHSIALASPCAARGVGEPPPRAEIEHARRLREVADDLLPLAMREIAERLERLQREMPGGG